MPYFSKVLLYFANVSESIALLRVSCLFAKFRVYSQTVREKYICFPSKFKHVSLLFTNNLISSYSSELSFIVLSFLNCLMLLMSGLLKPRPLCIVRQQFSAKSTYSNSSCSNRILREPISIMLRIKFTSHFLEIMTKDLVITKKGLVISRKFSCKLREKIS